MTPWWLRTPQSAHTNRHMRGLQKPSEGRINSLNLIMNSLVYECKPKLNGMTLYLHSEMTLKDSGEEKNIFLMGRILNGITNLSTFNEKTGGLR